MEVVFFFEVVVEAAGARKLRLWRLSKAVVI